MSEFASFVSSVSDVSGSPRRDTFIGTNGIGTGDLLSAFLQQHDASNMDDVTMDQGEQEVEQSFAERFPPQIPALPLASVAPASASAAASATVPARKSVRATVTARGTKPAASATNKPPLSSTAAIRQAKLAEWKNNTTIAGGSSATSAAGKTTTMNENRFATTSATAGSLSARSSTSNVSLSAKRKSVGLTPSTSTTNLRSSTTTSGAAVKKARMSSVGLTSARGIKIDAPVDRSTPVAPSPRKQWDGKRKSMSSSVSTPDLLPTVSELSPNHPGAAQQAKLEGLRQEKAQWQTSAQWRMLLLRVQKAELTAVKAQLEQAETSHASALRDLAAAQASIAAGADREHSLQTQLAASTTSESMLRLAAEELSSKVDDLRGQLELAKKEYEQEVKQLKEQLEMNQRTATESEQASAMKIDNLNSDIATLTTSEATLRMQLEATMTELANVNAQRYADEVARKKLHATIQDLKGSIRVFCRIRPSGVTSMKDTAADQPIFTRAPATTDHGAAGALANFTENLLVQAPAGWKTNVDGSAARVTTQTFNVDKVFDQTATQAELFKELEELVVSALDGSANVSVFAYGATGSGKTHTMMNVDAASPSDVGCIPRAIDLVFAYAEKAKERQWTYGFKAALLEIHCEEMKDLLAEHAKSGVAPLPLSSGTATSTRGASAGASDKDLKITHDRSGKVVVSNLETFPVSNASEVHVLLASGTKHRSVSATACNARSSRSHTIFQLTIEGSNAKTGEKLTSQINLIDLAGSERLDASKAGADPALLKETQAINSSLSALVTCMSAIASRASHVPYRSSTLTHLLQHALGKNDVALARTLFFVNISPEAVNYAETLCTMRFAEKLKSVETNVTAMTQEASNKRPKRK